MRTETIDVLIVTSADGEDDAVRATTDGARGSWQEMDRPSGYDFAIWRCEFDTPKGRPLRVALTRAAFMGVEGSGHAAAALSQYLHPRCLAMCGVCAGRQGWVDLGDVIIADRVFRYDVGEFVRETLDSPQEFHGDVITHPIRAAWKQWAEQWRGYEGATWLADRPRPRDLQEDWLLHEIHGQRDPRVAPDRARFCADWSQVAGRLLDQQLVELDDAGALQLTETGRTRIQRTLALYPDGLPEPSPFRVHVGPLGTGSNLVRDVDIWRKLSTDGQQRLLRGLDMEASAIGFAAFVGEIPWIVVKGVMDFAEPERPQGFRAFAARAAAEVLIGFLRDKLEPGRGAGEILVRGTEVHSAGGTNPGALLNARHEVVEFVDDVRRTELGEIESWCGSPEPVSARLFIGPGGAGKTRLFIEFAKRLRARGWDAGFLPERATEEDEHTVLASAVPTFLVIDYAETRASLVRLLDVAAASRSERRGKVRIALVAREDADWWRALIAHSTAIGDLLQRNSPFVLRPIEIDSDQRLKVYQHALTAFGKALQKPVPTGEYDLSDDRFGRMLYIEMAALAAVEGLQVRAEQLLANTVQHEVRYWAHAYRREIAIEPLDEADFKDQMARLGAAMTLHGHIAQRQEAEALSKRVGGPNEARFPHVLRFLHGLYAGPVGDDGERPYLAALEPDLLGEELTAQVLTSAETPSSYLVNVFDGADSRSLRSGFAVLGRLASRLTDEKIERLVTGLLGVDIPGRARAALTAALTLTTETAHAPLGRVLERVLAAQGTVELAKELAQLIPPQTVSLREVAVWATARVLETMPADTNDKELQTRRAAILTNLGKRLSDVGRHEDALTATEEAVRHYRSLAAEHPDASLPDRAMSLNNLGEMLSNLGRREDAFAATEEAVRHYRSLASTHPDAFLPALAMSLNNLGIKFSNLGRHEDALAATEEAVRHVRSLAATHPDAFLPELARSLQNLGNRLSDLGRREDALAAADEAVRIRRSLAASHPDAFLPDLATSLNNLGNRLSDLGRREDALAAADEAVRHYRSLAAARPNAFLHPLAMALNNLGNNLSDLGRREDALAAADEAVRHYRSLAAARPSAFLHHLAMSLTNLGSRLTELGRHEEALAVTDEAVSHYRSLATTHPDSFLPNLARSLSNLGSMLRDLRRHQDALAATAEAVRIGRHLVAARPDAFLHELAGTLSNLSVMLNDNGRCEDAFPPAHEAARHYRSLAAGRPDAFLPHLALSLSNMSAVLKGLSRLEDAFDAAEEAVRITIPFTRAHRHAFEKRLRQCSAILETCLTDLGHEPSSSSTLSIARQILATFEGSSDPSA